MKMTNNIINIKFLLSLAGSLIWPVLMFVMVYPAFAAPQPVADIKANGSDGVISVSYNSSLTVSWTSIYADWCAVEGVGWTGISGSQTTGNLTYDRTYNLGCSGPGGWTYDSVTILVGKQSDPSFSQGSLPSYSSGSGGYTGGYTVGTPPRFSAGCAAGPTTPEVGNTVSFAASSVNGVNPITYRWGGDVSGGGPTLTTSFSSTGTKIISVVATDSQGKSADASCSVNVVPVSPKVAPAPAPTPTPAPAPKPVITTASKTETDSASSPQADYDKICREMGYVKPDDVELAKNTEENNVPVDENNGKKRSFLASVFFTDSGYPSWLFFAILVLAILFVWTLTKLMNGKKKEIPTGQIKR